MLRARIGVPLRGSLRIIRRSKDQSDQTDENTKLTNVTNQTTRGFGLTSASDMGRWITVITWRRSIPVWVRFDKSQSGYQIVENYDALVGWRPRGASRNRGVDGISRCFVRLTTRRMPLCRLASREGIKKQTREYYAAFVAIEGRINGVFLVTDVLWFYVIFEAVLIPMYRRIGVWGSRARKIRAAYFFFRYTLVGSVRMLLGILYLNQRYGTTDIVTLKSRCNIDRRNGGLEAHTQQRRWRAFFASLAVKVPMVPVHIWLPEAHVEAPTGGSVILAGVLLKLGTYGIMRRLRERFPMGSVYYTPRVYVIAVVAIVYTSRTAIRQTDRKRIVAYASVAHINMTLVGLFSMTEQGIEGALFQMLSHGLVAGALFMVIGVLYDRYHTRRVIYYGGVAQTIPRFARVFLFFTMANIALPGTSSFVGERMILFGIAQTNTLVTVRSATGMVLGGAYSLWLYNRVAYGNLKTIYIGESINDLSRREGRMFTPLLRRTLFLGRYPSCVLEMVHASCVSRIEHVRRYS